MTLTSTPLAGVGAEPRATGASLHYRCLESVPAHDDAVNTVAAAEFGGLVLTGSADGTVKVWRREMAAGANYGRTA